MRAEIEKITPDIEYSSVKEALENFSKEGKPFALPKFKQQNRSSIKHRVVDLLGGFPYTNESYPWPRGGADGLHMQPIIQINLESASNLLDFYFGKGLLQVWGIVGADAASFDVIELAFNADFDKGIFTRVVPMDQILCAPSEFYPEFAPWLLSKESALDRPGLLFIEPSKEMSVGSLITWQVSEEFMYPVPTYEMHDIRKLAPSLSEMNEDVDAYELFEELKAAVTVGLKTPHDFRKCYLGGVRGYGEGRYADPAQGYPILISICGEINLSIIFDENIHVKPDRFAHKDGELVHFARASKLRAVYGWNE